MNELQVGQRVLVLTASGEQAERIVAGHTDEGEPLFCTSDEYQSAQRESREARSIGWPADAILGVNDAQPSGA